jgi:hypothetical protein
MLGTLSLSKWDLSDFDQFKAPNSGKPEFGRGERVKADHGGA